MPRPISDSIPEPVATEVVVRYGTLKDMCRITGLKYSRTRGVFDRIDNARLFKFEEFCGDLGVPMEALVDLIGEPDKLKSFIEDCTGSKVHQFYRDRASAPVSDAYVWNLLHGEAAVDVRDFYRPLARALGYSLDDLANILRGRTN